MRTIWVVRHCEPVKGGASVCLGQEGDPSLSPEGLVHAQRLGERFASCSIDNVYCSPLLRSRQTAACIGDCQVLADLTEQDMGEWDGLAWSTIEERYPELYAARARDNSLVPPGAETCEEVADRYERALLATRGNCVAVVQKGALSALLCRLLDKDPANLWEQGITYGACVRLVEHEGRLSVAKPDDR